MKPEPNPVNKIGERNYQCPNYDGCVEYAGKTQWPIWACSECPNQLQGTGVSLVNNAPRPAGSVAENQILPG
jgi:ribosomal protein L37AE/L43A